MRSVTQRTDVVDELLALGLHLVAHAEHVGVALCSGVGDQLLAERLERRAQLQDANTSTCNTEDSSTTLMCTDSLFCCTCSVVERLQKH